MTVRRISRLKPRDAIAWFADHPDVWTDLRDGKEADIPDEVFGECIGLEKVTKKKKEKLEVVQPELGGEE